MIFAGGDADEPLAAAGAFVFRASIRRSRRADFEFAAPVWSEDFIERYLGGDLRVREKLAMPTVGFCGHGAAHVLRAQALRCLTQPRRVRCNFLIRREFWDGTLGAPDRGARQQAARQQFVQNIVDSDYVLCIRGAGNFSYRLYETLCCGRIPVFVNTDCVLPYEDAIDWQRLCVWVEEHDIDAIADTVARYHGGLSSQQFMERQVECRQIGRTGCLRLDFTPTFTATSPACDKSLLHIFTLTRPKPNGRIAIPIHQVSDWRLPHADPDHLCRCRPRHRRALVAVRYPRRTSAHGMHSGF